MVFETPSLHTHTPGVLASALGGLYQSGCLSAQDVRDTFMGAGK